MLGRYELFLELAQSYLGGLWAVRVASGEGAGLIAMLREISLAEVNPSQAERLVHAARRDVPLEQPALMSTIEIITTPTELALVYDYVEAETLRALQSLSSVRRKPMPLDLALRIATDLLEAVSTMHTGVTGRILYGGISPDRILVGTDGRTRIIDVGVAAAANEVEAFGQHPERIAYAAPEQVGDNREIDARTDLFTIGILLWEMLSNRRLFIGSDQAVAQKVLAAKIPRLDQVKRRGDLELPEAVVSFVARALERDRDARHQSAAEMLSLLQQLGAPAERPQVAEFVELVSEGALGRRRDAIKDEMRGRVLEPLSSKIPRTPSAPIHGAAPLERPRDAEASSPRHDAPANGRPGKQTAIGLPGMARALPRPPPVPAPGRAGMKTIVGIPIAPITSAVRAAAPVHPAPDVWSGAVAKAATSPAASPTSLDVVAPAEKSAIAPRSPTPEALRAALTQEEDADSVRRARERKARAQEMAQPQDWDEDFVTTTTATTAQREQPAFPIPVAQRPAPIAQAALAPVAQFPAPSTAEPVTVPTNPAPTIPTSLPPSDPVASPGPPPLQDFGDEVTESDLAPPRLPDILETPKPNPLSEPSTSPGRRSPPGVSLPPAAIFPSQIPPPLIHDPRANFRPARAGAQQKPKYFARGVMAGMLGTLVVIALGIGLGLAIMHARQPAPQTVVQAEPASVATKPVPTVEEQPAPAETPPTSSASAAPEENQAEEETDGTEAAPTASASAPAPSASASAAAASPTTARAKAVASPKRAAPRRSKPRKFTPDDI